MNKMNRQRFWMIVLEHGYKLTGRNPGSSLIRQNTRNAGTAEGGINRTVGRVNGEARVDWDRNVAFAIPKRPAVGRIESFKGNAVMRFQIGEGLRRTARSEIICISIHFTLQSVYYAAQLSERF